MCSKVLNGHIILTDTSITTILAPEMTYTPIFMWSTIDGKLSLRQLLLRTRETASNNDPIEWIWSKD